MSNAEIILPSSDTIIILRSELERHLGRLLLSPGAALTGSLQRRHVTSGLELLVTQLEFEDVVPNADAWSLLADRVVVMVNHDQHIRCEEMATICHAGPSQTLLCILLDPVDRERMDVCICERSSIRRPARIGLIGPELKWLPEPSAAPVPFDETTQSRKRDDLRQSRTRGGLGATEHDRSRHLSIAFIGNGGGGSELTRQLVATLDPASVTTFDNDAVGYENLNAMPHASWRDAKARRNKSTVLAQALNRNQPGLKIRAVPFSITASEAIHIMENSRFDAVFTFADNNTARLAASWLCRTTATIHIDCGTLIRHDNNGHRSMRADCRLFEPSQTCIGCSPPMEDLRDALYDLSAPEHSLKKGRINRWNATRAGTLHHFNAFACSLTANLFLDYLSGHIQRSHWIRALWNQGHLPELTETSLVASDDCPFCRRKTSPNNSQ
ncbi:MAG: ThiF family adenylyltransferase [Planctomycetaceae bacterium]|nr:ThiF family adenylyltransferase [Planctomycetaceae bacterium]